MTNPLQNLPARLRSILYIAYLLLGVLWIAAAAYYDHDPEWVAGLGRVLSALSVPFAGLAASNVTKHRTASVVAPGSVTVLPDSRNPHE